MLEAGTMSVSLEASDSATPSDSLLLEVIISAFDDKCSIYTYIHTFILTYTHIYLHTYIEHTDRLTIRFSMYEDYR